jgi:hypothetical protein
MEIEYTGSPVDYYFCTTHGWVDAIHEVGYESGQFPTGYEDYYSCPVCGDDVIHEFEMPKIKLKG